MGCNGDVKSEEKVKEEKEEEDALAELKGCTQYDYQTDEIWDSSPYEPHIEDFELVVTSVEQLRELVLRFGPIPEDFGKKQEGVTVPKIKKKVGRPRFKNLKEDLKENNDGEEKENDEVNDDPEKETENNCEKENVSDNDKAVDEVTKDDKESKNKDIKKQADNAKEKEEKSDNEKDNPESDENMSDCDKDPNEEKEQNTKDENEKENDFDKENEDEELISGKE